MASLYPMVINPRFDERIWGGHNLAERLGKPAPRDKLIGESWEVYDEDTVANGPYAGCTIGELRREMGRDLTGHVDPGEVFPLLTKLLDAQQVLSVQVHPDDTFARELEGQPHGKTECWYVIHAEPGAEIIYGFARDSSPAEYEDLVAKGRLQDVLRGVPVHAGDVFYLPARTLHALGAGIMVYELQQTSDVTYRIYDWNRRDASGKPRELHVDKARQVLDYHRSTREPIRPLTMPDDGRSMLIAGPYFSLELIETGAGREMSTYQSSVVICALDRPVVVHAGADGGGVALGAYSSALIPASARTYTIQEASAAQGTARALVAYVPTSRAATRAELLDRGFSPPEVDSFLHQFDPVPGNTTGSR